MVRICSIVVLIACFGLAAFPQSPTIQSLGFMTGCWEINDPGKKFLNTEQWMAPAGNSMIGMARTVKAEKTTGFEYLRIVQDETGINYIAKPSASKEETPFKLLKWAENEATFENLAHDFPQRVIYKLSKPDSLWARIEGTVNGKMKGIDLPMTRAKCG